MLPKLKRKRFSEREGVKVLLLNQPLCSRLRKEADVLPFPSKDTQIPQQRTTAQKHLQNTAGAPNTFQQRHLWPYPRSTKRYGLFHFIDEDCLIIMKFATSKFCTCTAKTARSLKHLLALTLLPNVAATTHLALSDPTTACVGDSIS